MEHQLADDDESTINSTWTELFEEAVPFFLNVGMSYDDFWHGDCYMTRAYYRAWKFKQEKEFNERDTLAWLIGGYVADAIGCTFGKGKYPKKPRNIQEDDFVNNNQLSEEERAELWMRAFEASHRTLPRT